MNGKLGNAHSRKMSKITWKDTTLTLLKIHILDIKL